jgi:5,6-dimethylbenzimidazole synthase
LDVYEAIETRKSIRKFKPDPIPEAVIRKLLWAGTQAPNAFNREQWEFIIVKDKSLRHELIQLRANMPQQKMALETAPQIIVVCYNNYLGIDAMASVYACIENILLAATSEGIGSVTMTSHGTKIKTLLNIPEGYDVAAIMPIGYPDEDPEKPARIPLEDKIHIDGF